MTEASTEKKIRGVYEHPAGSGVWWINFYANGTRRREKIGSKSAAIKAYRSRKTAVLEDRKLPPPRFTRKVTLSALIDLALEAAANHKDKRNYVSKAAIVREALGDRPAAEIKPQEIEQWLRSRCKSAATANRYKAFISLCYRQGMRNGKVTSNPARLVQQQRESTGRIRFLTREEYNRLCAVIHSRFPEHLAEFIFAINTGMRLTEQYSCTWSQVDMTRRAIDLTETKNGTARTIHLNADALAAIESVRLPGQKPAERVFPREGSQGRYDTRSWFVPCLAEAKISGYVWHSNRHTFCSWLAMAGATIKEIQELAGHKTITMSARYAHLSPDHKLSVLDRITATATEQPPKTATRPAARQPLESQQPQRNPTAIRTATSRKRPPRMK
jgi:integrase